MFASRSGAQTMEATARSPRKPRSPFGLHPAFAPRVHRSGLL